MWELAEIYTVLEHFVHRLQEVAPCLAIRAADVIVGRDGGHFASWSFHAWRLRVLSAISSGRKHFLVDSIAHVSKVDDTVLWTLQVIQLRLITLA